MNPKQRIAYPGAAGSYTAEAASSLYPDGDLYSAGSFEDVARDVLSGKAAVGVLPIENSLAGLVTETFEILAEGDLPMFAEAILHIPHCLASVPGASLDGIRRIHSHPVALMQCRKFLNGRFEQFGSSTTADACQTVAAAGDPASAAIASPGAARRYGLTILLEEIADHPENYTRFVAVRREPPDPYDERVVWNTALRVVTKHEPGALHNAIEPLRYHAVNMVSLHSRPIPGEPWRYQFSLDIAGHPGQEPVRRALEDVAARSARLVVLGVYPAARPA